MASEWVGGILPVGREILGEGAFIPIVAVWLNERGLILGVEAGRQDAQAQLLRDALVKALASRAEPPATLRVDRQEWADAIRFAAPKQVTVRIAPTPELRDVQISLDRSVKPPGFGRQKFGTGGFTEGGTIPPEAIGALFEAAGRLFKCKPWELIPPDVPFSVDVPEMGIEGGCLTIMGHMGDVRGFAFYDTVEEFHDFLEIVESGDPVRGRQLHLGYEKKSDLARAAIREMERHGWEPAGRGATPFVFSLVDGEIIHSTVRDVRLCTALADAVHGFCGTLDGPLEEGLDELGFEAEAEAGAPAVSLLWPHPEAADPDGLFLDAFFHEMEEEKSFDLHLVDAFLESLDGFKEELGFWTADDVEFYLLRDVPSEVPLQEDELRIFPKLLGRLIRFGSEYFEGIDSRTVDVRLAQIRSLEPAFLAAIRDARLWSPGKAVVMRGLREGVDFGDHAAVDALVERFNRDRSPIVRTTPKVGRNDPCPCGSGKKSKKCCQASA